MLVSPSDVPAEGPISNEGKDVKMIDTLIEEAILDQGMIEIILDRRIT